MTGLSLIVCTRNRPDDLKRAIHSVVNAKRALRNADVEMMVIDDGNLDPSDLVRMKRQFFGQRETFVYINKSDRPGLLLSRIEGVKKATFDILLFIDDDVEIDKDYLVKLLETYNKNPTVVGVGGIDLLRKKKSRWQRFGEYLIGLRALNPGHLSSSGWNNSIDRWASQIHIFETEFLHGCNMSFQKSALVDILPNVHFRNVSVWEDLYLSLFARSYGKLVINPELKIKHYVSQVGRDRSVKYFYSLVMNQYELHKIFHTSFYKYFSLLLTVFRLLCLAYIGQFIQPMLKQEESYIALMKFESNNFREGIQRGLKDLCKGLFTQLVEKVSTKQNVRY